MGGCGSSVGGVVVVEWCLDADVVMMMAWSRCGGSIVGAC